MIVVAHYKLNLTKAMYNDCMLLFLPVRQNGNDKCPFSYFTKREKYFAMTSCHQSYAFLKWRDINMYF